VIAADDRQTGNYAVVPEKILSKFVLPEMKLTETPFHENIDSIATTVRTQE
jgi:hypothetical protein